ncbi:MAG: FAD-binding oxidoreductase [Elusimicrobia bacterium]|nr:FAD-binding oxidoreductase [Elusimicrobiota bacterium]
MKNYDVIIAGAGSAGVPLAMFLAENKIKVLVLEKKPSCGQGQNKAAIGGIRATHSDGSKIKTCLKSLEIFSSWHEKEGEDIGWRRGGYLFPVYREKEEKTLKELLKTQEKFGLNINWISAQEVKELVKGINEDGLIGGTFSPNDGSASPLLSINAFYRKAVSNGAEFSFNEQIKEVKKKGNLFSVKTSDKEYETPIFINAAGAHAKEISLMLGVDIPVKPDCHEAGITEPAERFVEPMVVDIREGEKSKNYYFYQNFEGQIIFCMTPDPQIWGYDRKSTSEFLPEISKRMLNILPGLSNIKVRRVWRGLYPMTPDGFPIVQFDAAGVENYIIAAGMCGQGFMLGPGLGWIISKIITKQASKEDESIYNFRLNRDFSGQEKLK